MHYQKPASTPSMKKAFFGYMSVLFIIAVFAIGLYIGRGYTGNSNSARTNFINTKGNSEVDFQLFWDVYDILEKKYVGRPLDKQKILYGAIEGMVRSLDDPYTAFMNPETTKQFEEEISGTFEGIGIELGMKNKLLTVIAAIKNAPAEKAGVKSKDIIYQIDDKSTVDMTLDEAVRLIRGPKGTKVNLAIKREGSDDLKQFEITRDTIEVKSVTYEKKDNDIFVIKLSRFSEDTATEFDKAVDEFFKSNSRKLVLDLRDDPGGFLEAAIDVASEFIENGTIVTEEFTKDDKKEYKARGRARLEKVPTIVLINGGSASASEIVAGALRDTLGVKLVGEKTFGKGSVQEFEKLKSGSSLRITVAKWLTPKGKNINENGLEPDVSVELADDDYNNDKDPQLEKALELIKT